MASDYNRALSPEMRFVHVAIAWLRQRFGAPIGWVFARERRFWAAPVVLGVVFFVLLHPLDAGLSRLARSLPLAGDVKRELTAWQQYGALTSLLVVGGIVILLDSARWRRVFDLAAASILTSLACSFLKNFVGRPRPILGDAHTFLGPWGMYPLPVADAASPGGTRMTLVHAWNAPRSSAVELWSMPSSHTALAVVLSIFLTAMYPRIRPLAIGLAIFVGMARVITGAHWPTDVVVGAALGYAISVVAINRHWGIRAMDWAWKRLIDPNAAPTALPLKDER